MELEGLSRREWALGAVALRKQVMNNKTSKKIDERQ